MTGSDSAHKQEHDATRCFPSAVQQHSPTQATCHLSPLTQHTDLGVFRKEERFFALVEGVVESTEKGQSWDRYSGHFSQTTAITGGSWT